MDNAELDQRDPDFIREYASPFLNWWGDNYFRISYQDIENLPKEGPVVVVGNHGGGPLLPDVFMMAAIWWKVFGPDVPSYAMVHDLAFRLPSIGELLYRIGALPASRENASKVLAAGGYLLAFPGGEQEAQRTFLKRDTIDFRGRTGFIATALEHGAPILPVVNVGGHEVYLTLTSSAFLARITGLRALTGLKELPVNVGLPWGIWSTAFLPYFPLPSKITYRVGKPVHIPKDPALAKDREYVEHLYCEITSTMQAMVDDLSAERRLPVIG
jgi:1-acyl-sn-glycerol-3-phosphate acyltransferase